MCLAEKEGGGQNRHIRQEEYHPVQGKGIGDLAYVGNSLELEWRYKVRMELVGVGGEVKPEKIRPEPDGEGHLFCRH